MITLLEKKRVDARMTREQLAAQSKVPERTIRELETVARRPRLETLIALADALKVKPSELAADFASRYAEREAA